MHSKLSGRGMRQGKAQHGRQSNCKIIHLAKGRGGLVFGVFHQCHIDTHTQTHSHTQAGRQADNNKASGKRRRNYKERMFRLISKHSKAEKEEKEEKKKVRQKKKPEKK